MTIFLRLLDVSADEKGDALRREVSAVGTRRVVVDASVFSNLPGSIFAYWIGDGIRDAFTRIPAFEKGNREIRQGLATADDFRFVRIWSEVDSSSWAPISKGGSFSPYYYDNSMVCLWASDGAQLGAFAGSVIRNPSYFRRPGLTWPSRPFRRGGFSAVGAGSLFSHTGPMIFAAPKRALYALGALLNSDSYIGLLHVLMPRGGEGSDRTLKYEVGYLSAVPVPEISPSTESELAELFVSSWKLFRKLDTVNENSRQFELPKKLAERTVGWDEARIRGEINKTARRINNLAFCAYGFSESDLPEIESWARGGGADAEIDLSAEIAEDEFQHDSQSAVLSWSAGVVFGRFDIRLATGERVIPPEPDPFDELPAKSPGMLPDGDPPFMPTSDVFVDDPGHADDIAARVTAVYERVGEAPLAPDELRRTLAKDFFPAHLRRYSKSRRKAPIYWQLATPSASYSAWLYIHAFTKDTLFRVQNDYLAPKLRDERQQLDRLRVDGGAAPTTAQSRAIEEHAVFVEELSSMLEEVRRVAPLWSPDLDDGVILNFAPLWRLVPQNRAWQKECRMAWEALVKGDYDWAHLAMRLWPERVIPKCAKDRSLAIAHDLEGVFWVEGADGKWTTRKAPTRPIDDLIAERTSPAVKAALASLLEAPEPVTAPRRRGRTTG